MFSRRSRSRRPGKDAGIQSQSELRVPTSKTNLLVGHPKGKDKTSRRWLGLAAATWEVIHQPGR
ncbi:MAG: hypothetical protein ACE5JX_17810, partial [Acidobacteriota bacterium]